MVVDARGYGCPKPVIMAEDALNGIDEGTVDVLVDNEASVNNLLKFAARNGFFSETSKEDNYWRVKIAKGYICEIENPESAMQSSESEEKPEKDLLLIIGSDVMGKEQELGRILMKGTLETMKVTKEIPHTIFFLNAGVKLTTLDSEIVPVLKELEAMGVEIFSCGTCLKYYGLESELKVGYRGTGNHIVEGMQNFRKTVWIG
jgi:selenium metabolism protein YedF